MNKNRLLLSLLLGVVSFVGMVPIVAHAQTLGGYIDNSPTSNYSLNRYYSLGYMNASVNSNAYILVKNDISAVGENPASEMFLASDDHPMGFMLGYTPEQKDKYLSTLVFSVKTSDVFTWHAFFSWKSSGVQTITPSVEAPDFYTGQLTKWSDVQSGDDFRYTFGVSFRPDNESKFAFGANFDYQTSCIPTGTFNLNSKDNARAATMDFSSMYNDQDDDGNGLSLGVRFRNISFANKYSTLMYSPRTTATYQALYGMKRYIPAYTAAGAGYRLTLSTGEQLAFAGEIGIETGGSIPDTANSAETNRYLASGAIRNMFSTVSSVMGNVAVAYSRPFSQEWTIDGKVTYMVDPYTRAPYVTAGIGRKFFHFYVGYLIAGSKSNSFGSQLSFGLRMNSIGRQ